jgi:hypothetical protein
VLKKLILFLPSLMIIPASWGGSLINPPSGYDYGVHRPSDNLVTWFRTEDEANLERLRIKRDSGPDEPEADTITRPPGYDYGIQHHHEKVVTWCQTEEEAVWEWRWLNAPRQIRGKFPVSAGLKEMVEMMVAYLGIDSETILSSLDASPDAMEWTWMLLGDPSPDNQLWACLRRVYGPQPHRPSR